MRGWLAFVAVGLVACATPRDPSDFMASATTSACIPDREAVLALDPIAFDQDPDGGWRAIAKTPSCELAAADLIAEYRSVAAGRPGAERIWDSLIHHEGQVRAANGQTQRALVLFREVLAIHLRESGGLDDTNTLRDRAEIAFLEGDRGALIGARDQLAALPMPPGMAKALEAAAQRSPERQAPAWPLNLGFTDRLVNCFGRSYREATKDGCPDSSPSPAT